MHILFTRHVIHNKLKLSVSPEWQIDKSLEKDGKLLKDNVYLSYSMFIFRGLKM